MDNSKEYIYLMNHLVFNFLKEINRYIILLKEGPKGCLNYRKMENLIENKEKAQFLSLIIKKISKDRLNSKEIKSYESLKFKVDPDSKLEDELTREWEKAEVQSIAERTERSSVKASGFSVKRPKNALINLVGKVLSIFI